MYFLYIEYYWVLFPWSILPICVFWLENCQLSHWELLLRCLDFCHGIIFLFLMEVYFYLLEMFLIALFIIFKKWKLSKIQESMNSGAKYASRVQQRSFWQWKDEVWWVINNENIFYYIHTYTDICICIYIYILSTFYEIYFIYMYI